MSSIRQKTTEKKRLSWDQAYRLLRVFWEREDHARVPSHHIEAGYALGNWVSSQRKLREKLSRQQRENLQRLPGWVWNELDARWEKGYAQLVAYIKREKHAGVPASHKEKGFTLGRWVQAQRKNRARLNQERRDRLESLPGWAWNILEERWHKGYRLLINFARHYGHANVPVKHIEEGFGLILRAQSMAQIRYVGFSHTFVYHCIPS